MLKKYQYTDKYLFGQKKQISKEEVGYFVSVVASIFILTFLINSI